MFAKAHLTTPAASGICLGSRERRDFGVVAKVENLTPA